MAVQLSTDVRDDRIGAIETTIGASPILRIYDLDAGAPADCAAAITGTVLVEMNLPADWLTAPASGSVGKNGTWQDPSANASGIADFFRIYDSGDAACHIQGTVGETGSGEDLELDNTDINAGQQVTITTFNLTDGGA